ncbi:MAG: LysR family transcriptional regulator [Pseudomonadota bacterium]
MDTEGVRLFVMAADMLNISAAGRRLGLAPAVASARLAKLEGQLGADLLHRSTRKVSLSLAGEEFLPFAREMLAQEDAAKAALGLGRSEVAGTIRFAAPSSFAQLYIAPIIPDFIERYPGVGLQLRLSDTQVDLIEGGYDLALRNASIEDSSLRARKLADDTRVLCASPDYLARHGTPGQPEDLADHRALAFRDAAARTLSAGPELPTSLFPPPQRATRVTCDDGTSLKIATMAGAGISMNALWSVHAELKAGSLQRVLPEYEIEDRSALWLVYPKANVLTAKVRVLIDFLLEKIGRPPVWER